ncbi:MAG: hypothetical protein RMA76_13975 [Deltaproteobacteria bacterium]
MSVEAFVVALRSALAPRRGLVRDHFSIAFAVVDGAGFTVDTRKSEVIERRYRAGCDLSILCNTATLEAIGTGAFDASNPGTLFRWGGDAKVFARLRELLNGGQSMVALRAAR